VRQGGRPDGVYGAPPLPALSAAGVTVRRGTPDDVDAIAQLWAEATAARDRDPDVAGLELSRPLILEALARPGAVAMVAVDGGEVVAFALAHRAGEIPRVQYLAVSPRRWGEGLAAAALEALVGQLAADGDERATLSVYADNASAIRMYERLGWERMEGGPTPHPRTGKPELTYVRELR
jgi:ribosomal protein S18 acetylase RimI-like enzyme